VLDAQLVELAADAELGGVGRWFRDQLQIVT
jgi:hypothetical protein